LASRELLFDFTQAEAIPGARLLGFSGGGGSRRPGGFSSVCIDSRRTEEGSLFVALAGSSRDGHFFVKDAFDRGAAAAMVGEAQLQNPALGLEALADTLGRVLIVVPDTLRGLQDAARLYLKQFPGLLKICVTGSAGKTTTKEIAAAIIGQEKKVVYNPGNLNSETGLPLAVFTVRSGHEVGIFEMGMNRRGEITELTRVLEPHIALITNIGSAHIGILGSLSMIAQEKKNIFALFSGTETALIPENDDFKGFLAQGVKGKAVFYGEGAFKEWGGSRSLGLEGSEILWAGKPVRFGLPGIHNLNDALAAIALAREVPVSDEAIRKGLESVKPLFGRSEIIEGPVTVIQDYYNASPESSAAALAFCDSLDWGGRRIYVLGSMLELGKNSREAHERLGRTLAGSRADMVFLFGVEMEAAAETMARSGGKPFFYTRDRDELSRILGSYARLGDLVLLKGSRANALEYLSGVLTEIQEQPAFLAGRGIN
jgi:UDP-N-acetylmuramoyl-tripeptide--D-alanyl-D-alanine ligase